MAPERYSAHFYTSPFTFTVWTLTGRLPKQIMSVDSCTAGVRAARWSRAFGANYVGRSRGNASKPAVVHLTGAPRPARARFVGRIGTFFGRRFDRWTGAFGLVRLQSSGSRGTD